jgi:hypothetical protein
MGGPEAFEPHQNRLRESAEIKQLPEALDNRGVIFAYGFLLDQPKLRELLNRTPADFPIYETTDMEEAKMLATHPDSVVILRDVRLDGLRVDIHSEQQYRDWMKTIDPDTLEATIEEGILKPQGQPNASLYARTASPEEYPRFLNGGLICGLRPEELKRLDKFELDPVYKRTRTPELTIGGETYVPREVTFYAGRSDLDPSPEEPARTRELLKKGRRVWPREVRNLKPRNSEDDLY